MKFLFTFAALVSASILHAAESAGPTLAQGQARLLRHPSYSNGKVAFSYLGDIWIANGDGGVLCRRRRLAVSIIRFADSTIQKLLCEQRLYILFLRVLCRWVDIVLLWRLSCCRRHVQGEKA